MSKSWVYPMKPFSVIIPTYNNRTLKNGSLRATLLSLRKDSSLIEGVYVIDNCSTDGGVDQAMLPLRDIDCALLTCAKRSNRAAARNIGIRESNTPYLLFMDDDMIAPAAGLTKLFGSLTQAAVWTAARRYYVPLGHDMEAICRAIESDDLAYFSRVATALPGRAQPSKPWHACYMFSFLTSYGIVSRSLLERVGGFDESFEGWGHEDAELLVRLLECAPLRSLYSDYVCYHLDHYVSPYQWLEQERNFVRFREMLRNRGRDFDILRFAELVTKNEDISLKLLISRQENRWVLPMQADPAREVEVRQLVSYVIDEVADSAPVIGLVLAGSSLREGQPNDFDLLVTTQYGEHRFMKRRFDGIGPAVEIEVIPADYFRRLLSCHLSSPGNWLLEIGKWYHGFVIWDRYGTIAELRMALIKPDASRTLFGVTFFLGRAAILVRKARSDATLAKWACWEARNCLGNLMHLADGIFPRNVADLYPARYPEDMDIEQTWQIITQLTSEQFSTPPVDLSVVRIYYPENAHGLEVLQERFSTWRLIHTEEMSI